ncbi:C-C motif chemokine 20b [Cottoperca gobio]|uniref:C-C motif chemokine 20b n=1 Tax=Cottoperca gobio TaxID=56716 RepID=A0A6J2RUF6_COTGO|nr:C-C motif chemokine 20-like [Cottoperca gobio]
MTKSKVCLATLCSLFILTTFIGSTQSVSCCLRYTSRRFPCQRLLGYTIQNINTSCDIEAVIFHLPGRFMCVDPSNHSTRRGVKCVDERKRKSGLLVAKRSAGSTKSS